LPKMAKAVLAASAATTTFGGTATTTVTLKYNGAGPVPAFFVEAALRDAQRRGSLPVSWSDDDVTLWPGETVKLLARTKAGRPLSVDVAGMEHPSQERPRVVMMI
jgi:exo-1,4-beta-D-glucosaminidase